MIAVVELNRYNTKVEPEVQLMSVPQYIQGLNKQKQIKLAVAIDLAKQSLEK
jgi:hypothetical protein